MNASRLLQNVLAKVAIPIRRDDVLNLLECQIARTFRAVRTRRANAKFQGIFDLILRVGTDNCRVESVVCALRMIWCAPHLRPQVLLVARMATKLKRNEVIFLEMSRIAVALVAHTLE